MLKFLTLKKMDFSFIFLNVIYMNKIVRIFYKLKDFLYNNDIHKIMNEIHDFKKNQVIF